MTLTPGFRKFTLTVHVTSSVGWLGAVVVFLALAVAGWTSDDAADVRSAYLAMETTGWVVLLPLAIAGRNGSAKAGCDSDPMRVRRDLLRHRLHASRSVAHHGE